MASLNQIQQLHSSLVAQLPVRIPVPTETKLDAPEDRTGETWWLDVWGAGRHVVIEWRPARPHRQDQFGVSLVNGDGAVVEASEEWFSFEGTVERIVELICEGDLGG